MMTAPERWPSETTLTGIALSAKSMMSGASMYAALIRPVISDSLISGQPLYLLNSNSGLAPAAAQATGSVRLHVTGRPPTSNGFAGVCARGRMANEPSAAAPPSSTLRRRNERGGRPLM